MYREWALKWSPLTLGRKSAYSVQGNKEAENKIPRAHKNTNIRRETLKKDGLIHKLRAGNVCM
jgi:hypothetical protein